jgi:hypothetical protein
VERESPYFKGDIKGESADSKRDIEGEALAQVV